MERNTRQRTLILENLSKRFDHPTAYDVYKSVKEQLPNISLTTVYRNLNNLANEGKLMRIMIANKPDRFDITVKSHCHVNCEMCGCFFDYVNQEADCKMRKQLLDDYGFTATKCDLVFYGVCRNCKSKIENNIH